MRADEEIHTAQRFLATALTEPDPALKVLRLALAIREIAFAMSMIASAKNRPTEHRRCDAGSVLSPSENAAEARRVIEQLRGGT